MPKLRHLAPCNGNCLWFIAGTRASLAQVEPTDGLDGPPAEAAPQHAAAACERDGGGGSGPAGWRSWWLVPEGDTALYPDQAGDLAHNPAMLLQYAAHVQALYRARGRNVSIKAVSCVSVNSRPAQATGGGLEA